MQESRLGKRSASHSLGSAGTNCLLTAVQASISIVPGDNNLPCALLECHFSAKSGGWRGARRNKNTAGKRYGAKLIRFGSGTSSNIDEFTGRFGGSTTLPELENVYEELRSKRSGFEEIRAGGRRLSRKPQRPRQRFTGPPLRTEPAKAICFFPIAHMRISSSPPPTAAIILI